jgi:hypothetical protein
MRPWESVPDAKPTGGLPKWHRACGEPCGSIECRGISASAAAAAGGVLWNPPCGEPCRSIRCRGISGGRLRAGRYGTRPVANPAAPSAAVASAAAGCGRGAMEPAGSRRCPVPLQVAWFGSSGAARSMLDGCAARLSSPGSMRPSESTLPFRLRMDSQGRMDHRMSAGWQPMLDKRLTSAPPVASGARSSDRRAGSLRPPAGMARPWA